jgi:hypothetical protein
MRGRANNEAIGRARPWHVVLDVTLSRWAPCAARLSRSFAKAADLDRRLGAMATSGGIGKHLRSFLATATYLYACFGLLLLYKAMILHDRGIDYTPYGLAAGKALLLAKFMLIGDKLQLGAQIGGGNRIYLILRKSGFFFLLIIVLSVVEEAIVGILHNRSVGATLVGLGHGRIGEIMATSLLLFVILIPYFAYREIDTMLGAGKLLEMLRSSR